MFYIESILILSAGGLARVPQNLGPERPFLGPHFLPSLENHLMNMHISVAESSNFVMTGLSKPPPYHIALYLPVPDEQCENPGSARKEEGSETIFKNGMSQNMQNQNPSHSQRSQPSSWMQSCLDEGEDGPRNGKTDEDADSEWDEGTSDRNLGEDGPRRKRRRNNERPETPPPPYGQI